MSQQIVALASDLYTFMSATERLGELRRRPGTLESWAHRAAELAERFKALAADAGRDVAAVAGEAAEHLQAFASEVARARERVLRERWRALGRAYESLVSLIRRLRLEQAEGVRLAHLKPKNYHRNLFHVANGVVGVAAYELLPWGGVLAVAGILLAIFVGLDVGRRISPRFNETLVHGFFGKISRPHEMHRTPSAVWYLAGLFVGVLLLPKHAIEIGALVLAFGDPAASLVGKRFGTRKLLGEKSLEGSLAFVGMAAAVSLAFLSWARPDLAVAARLGVALAAGFAGAAAELLSGRVDDNLTTPLVAGLVVALLL